jgi:hypothetical protein
MDPFSCWDRLEARGNDEDDSEDEGVLQRMALEKLASQLQEADTAFEESPSQVDENDDVQVVLDLASKLTKTKTSGKSESESFFMVPSATVAVTNVRKQREIINRLRSTTNCTAL